MAIQLDQGRTLAFSDVHNHHHMRKLELHQCPKSINNILKDVKHSDNRNNWSFTLACSIVIIKRHY